MLTSKTTKHGPSGKSGSSSAEESIRKAAILTGLEAALAHPLLGHWDYRIPTGLAPEIPRFPAKTCDGTSPFARLSVFAKIKPALKFSGFRGSSRSAFGTDG